MDMNKTYKALEKLEKASTALREAGFPDAASSLDDMYDLINNELCEAQNIANDVKSEIHTDDDCMEDVLEDESLSNIPFDNRGDYND